MTITPLTDADEYLNHQIANTFSTVETSDHSWAEKIWFTLVSKDGRLQVNFGLGKYTNRNVIDGFAGIARGTEQRTVRVSRRLRPNIDDLTVGPLRFEIIKPYQELRLTLEENSAQPIRFCLTWTSRMPAMFEGRDRVHDNGRISSDVIRYHQAGTVSGWVEIDGERTEVKADEWFGFRDHSWGTREYVGLPPTDLAPNNQDKLAGMFHFNWFVSQIRRPDGSYYDLAYYFRDYAGDRGMEHFTGFINESDGTQTPILRVYPELTYRKQDHAMMGGKIYVLLAGPGREVTERVFEVEALNPELGFRLHPALYLPWKGSAHGSYKGDEWIDGECIEDVNAPDKLENNPAWQLRDRPLIVREGENSGYADLESVVLGDWPSVTRI